MDKSPEEQGQRWRSLMEVAHSRNDPPDVWEKLIVFAQEGVKLTSPQAGSWRFNWLAVAAPNASILEDIGIAATGVNSYTDEINDTITLRMAEFAA